MKKILIVPAVLAVASLMRLPAVSHAGSADLTLADAPRGAWLATLRSDATLTVIGERDGWKRVRLEGWLPGGPVPSGNVGDTGGGPAEPGGGPAQLPKGGGATVRGVLLPADGSALAGGGLIVLLLSDLEGLDREHAKAGEACHARVQEVDARLESLRADLARALNSSENFREATRKNDRVKEQIRDAQAERSSRLRDCRQNADSLFDRHALRRAISDGRGAFEFEAVPPGRYRVVATEAGGEAPRSWSLECVVGEKPVVLDPRHDRSPVEPYWGLR